MFVLDKKVEIYKVNLREMVTNIDFSLFRMQLRTWLDLDTNTQYL